MSKKTKKRAVLEEAVKAVGLEPDPDVLNKEDYENIANQCYHNKDAAQLSTYNAIYSKYAVLYRSRWFFVVYNRDKNKATSSMDIDTLTDEESTKFNQYKNRLAMLKVLQSKKE